MLSINLMIFTENGFEYAGVRETTCYRKILLRLVVLTGDPPSLKRGNVIEQSNLRFVKC